MVLKSEMQEIIYQKKCCQTSNYHGWYLLLEQLCECDYYICREESTTICKRQNSQMCQEDWWKNEKTLPRVQIVVLFFQDKRKPASHK